MPQRAKSVEEKKAGAVSRVTRYRARRRAAANDLVAPAEPVEAPQATGIPPATNPTAVNSLAIVPSDVSGKASSPNLTDGASVPNLTDGVSDSPMTLRPEVPDLPVSADELDTGLSDTLEQLEGLRLTAGTEQAVESIVTSPPRKGYHLRSTLRSSPHSSLSVTTEYPSHGTGPRPQGTNRKEGEAGAQGENEDINEGNEEEGNDEERNEEEENGQEEEGIGGDEGVAEQHGVEEEVGNVLRTAWDAFCHCELSSESPSSERDCSLAELTQYWNEQLPLTARPSAQKLPTPLGCPTILARDNSHNDYTGIAWELLLAGLEQRPHLDFAKSESAFQERTSTSTAQIQRYWDVDSFLARITTLAAHKHGVRLAYNAPFHQRITKSLRVKFGGYAPEKVKQIRLGQGLGDGGWGFSTYVLFPHMPLIGSTFLGRDRRACWIDDIIYPALKASCSASILQHHPRGFQDALNRANVKNEINTTRGGQPYDFMYIVPASALERFWAEVLRRANDIEPFREPILVVIGHNLKLAFQRTSSAEARAAFLNCLDACYDTREEYMPLHETWLDFGAEDVPIQVDQQEGITLLRKSPCLEHWLTHFHCPQSRASRATASRFPFMLTRDAASMSVKLHDENQLRDKGGLAYHKAYNLNKDLFWTPQKDHGPFDNPHLHALGLTSSQISQWYASNRRGQAVNLDQDEPSTFATYTKAQQIKAYEASKTRVAQALLAANREKINFGVRQEYRITLARFRQVVLDLDVGTYGLWELPSMLSEENTAASLATSPSPLLSAEDDGGIRAASSEERTTPPSPSHPITRPRHRGFWILPTQEVHDFIAAAINRWIFCLEALASRSIKGPGALGVVEPEEQHLNSVMVSALIGTLQLSLGGSEAATKRSLWRTSWKTRRIPPRSALAHSSAESEEDGDEDEEAEVDDTQAVEFLGLRYRDTLRDCGTVWLPPDMIDWGALPVFKRSILRRLALAQQDPAFQQVFHATQDIQGKLTRESIRMQHLRAMLRNGKQRHEAIVTGGELVVQKYIQTVFAIVLRRATEGITNGAEVRKIQQRMTDRLTPQELAGYHGLSHDQVHRLLGHPPLIAYGRGSRSPAVYFTSHASGRWRDRIQELFQWDDHPGRKPRGWDTEPFRQLARHIHWIVEQETDAEGAADFFRSMLLSACDNLFILPHYDCDKLSVLQKSYPQQDPGTRANIRGLPPLKRMQWIIAQVPPADRDAYYEVMRYQGTGIPSAAAAIRQSVKYTELLVCGTDKVEKDKMAGVIYVPSSFGITLELGYARRFNRLVGQKTGDAGSAEGSITSATDEEESGDDEEEDNEGDDEGEDNKGENNEEEDYKGDDKEEDDVGEE